MEIDKSNDEKYMKRKKKAQAPKWYKRHKMTNINAKNLSSRLFHLFVRLYMNFYQNHHNILIL